MCAGRDRARPHEHGGGPAPMASVARADEVRYYCCRSVLHRNPGIDHRLWNNNCQTRSIAIAVVADRRRWCGDHLLYQGNELLLYIHYSVYAVLSGERERGNTQYPVRGTGFRERSARAR